MTISEVGPSAASEIGASSPHLRGFRPKSRRQALIIAGFTVVGIALFFAYLGQAETIPVRIDGSSQVLQAWDMLHGNPLLRGWWLTDVSFYTTELPQYMLIELVRGLSGSVMHIAAAMTYTLLVLGVAVLAKGDATGRQGLFRMLIAVGILLAPPLGLPNMTGVVLSNPDHTGTQVPMLLIWLLLERVRPRWWLPILIAVLLTWIQIADSLVLFEGVVPLVLVCGIRVIRRRGRLADQWYELSLAAGALLSALVATETLRLIRHVGGFVLQPPNTSFLTISRFTAQFWPRLQNELTLFGANFFGLQLQHAVVPLLHLVCVILVIWAVVIALRGFTRQDSLMMQLITVTFVALLVEYMFSTHGGVAEAVGLLPIGAILAGRLLPERLAKANLIIPLAAVLACFGLLLLRNALTTAPADESVKLAAWLQAHGLRYGLERYGQPNAITLDSGRQVQVRPIVNEGNKLVVREWNTVASWYDPSLHDATFVIWLRKDWQPQRRFAGLGLPTKTYYLGKRVVAVWDHSNLLSAVSPGPVIPRNVIAGGSREMLEHVRIPPRT